jgi:hypothetical protein
MKSPTKPQPVELISWRAAAELMCPGAPPHKRTLQRWFAREPRSPIVRLSSKKNALNLAVVQEIIARRAAATA